MENVLIIVYVLVAIAFGILAFKFEKIRKFLLLRIENLVNEAERYYIDEKGAGRKKFDMVMDSFLNTKIKIKVLQKDLYLSPSMFFSKNQVILLIENAVKALNDKIQ